MHATYHSHALFCVIRYAILWQFKVGQRSRCQLFKCLVPLEMSRQKNTHLKYKALFLRAQKFMPKLTFYKMRSKVTLKVTYTNFKVPWKRSCHKYETGPYPRAYVVNYYENLENNISLGKKVSAIVNVA